MLLRDQNSSNKIEFDKIIVYSDRIIIKKTSRVFYLDDIESLFYARWSIKNYFSLAFGDYKSPGFLYIILKNGSFIRKKNSIKFHYSDIEKLPNKVKKKLEVWE